MGWDFDGETMPFGKYEGYTVAWIVDHDRRYARWVADTFDDDEIGPAFAEELEQREMAAAERRKIGRTGPLMPPGWNKR